MKPKVENPTAFDVTEVRSNFPILNQKVYGNPLVYFDNAASAQKPLAVINAISNYYLNDHANVHRGVHHLSQRATDKFEQARLTIQSHVNAQHNHEIIFTKGTTDAINLVAHGFAKNFLMPNDEVLISGLEHHSNIVPWQMACEQTGAKLKVIEVFDNGELNIESFDRLLSNKTKLVAVSHVSNTLGTINPIKYFIEKAHEVGAAVLIDGAQAVPHLKVDVQDLGCDFYCFSGHKLFGPTGTGVLYGNQTWLNKLAPYQGGGEMIESVSFEKTTYNVLPFKFEAGTPNIADFIGLAAAIDYVNQIGLDQIATYENQLLNYAKNQLEENFSSIRFIGTAAEKASVISFLLGNQHPYDTGTILDQMGVAVRTGHHCTEPLMKRFNIPGTVRASFAFYNTLEEVDVFVRALKKAEKLLGV